MRQRRAERCLQHAHAALIARKIDDARSAWAEARELAPSLPALAEIERMIDAFPARRSGARRKLHAAGCVAGVVLAALMAWRAWTRDAPEPPRHASASTTADIALAAPREMASPALPHVEEPLRLANREPAPEPRPVDRVAVKDVQEKRSELASGDARNRPEVERSAAPAVVPIAPRPPLEITAPAPIVSPAVTPTTVPALPVDSTPVDPPVDLTMVRRAAAPADTSPLRGPLALADTTAARGPIAQPDTAAIRRTLARYEAAYSDRDASAARAVWPSVDQRALQRAFEGLAAQRISFDDCDVLVTGATARATCSGTATWTAKIGGGGRSEARRWAFQLKNADGAWQIVQASTR
jgi:hypothetical protein